MSDKPSVKVYFENLNAIRAIAAILVLIHHVEQFKHFFNIPNSWDNGFVFVIGKLGVVLFFVLSGFLISYLLFVEEEVTGTVSISKFYIRRALRIWPLYFLIVLLAFLILPSIDFFTIPGMNNILSDEKYFYKLFVYIVFIPNVFINSTSMIPFAAHLWSIGAEEQFYAVWPVLNKFIKNKWGLTYSVIITYLLLKFSLYLFTGDSIILREIQQFHLYFPIDCMAIGGIFALIVYKQSSLIMMVRNVIYQPVVQYITLILTICLMAAGYRFRMLHYEAYSILFGILICNFASNENRIFSMENKVTNYLGKISYGIYMYHPITIIIIIKLSIMAGITSNILIYSAVYLLSVLIPGISYKFYEKRFIVIKTKFSNILSGDNAIIN